MCLDRGVLWSPGAPTRRPGAGRRPGSQRTGTKAALCGARRARMRPGTQPGHRGMDPCPPPAPAGTAGTGRHPPRGEAEWWPPVPTGQPGVGGWVNTRGMGAVPWGTVGMGCSTIHAHTCTRARTPRRAHARAAVYTHSHACGWYGSVCAHTPSCAHIHKETSTQMRVRIYTRPHTSTHTHEHVRLAMHMRVSPCPHTRALAHTSLHAHVHTHATCNAHNLAYTCAHTHSVHRHAHTCCLPRTRAHTHTERHTHTFLHIPHVHHHMRTHGHPTMHTCARTRMHTRVCTHTSPPAVAVSHPPGTSPGSSAPATEAPIVPAGPKHFGGSLAARAGC